MPRSSRRWPGLVENRPSRGFWKCYKLLRRQGREWNHKRVYRVYCAMKLNLRRKANSCGRRFRTFNVVDDCNREAVHIEVDTSIASARLKRVFERLQHERGLPQVLRMDNGPEFLGETFTAWTRNNAMAIQYIQPGKPNQNAYI